METQLTKIISIPVLIFFFFLFTILFLEYLPPKPYESSFMTALKGTIALTVTLFGSIAIYLTFVHLIKLLIS